MRRSLVWLMLLFALACSAPPMTPAGGVDGVWTLTSPPFTPVEPRSLSLHEQGSSVTGTATAMGVDAPLPLTAAGAIQDTALDLQLGYMSTGENVGRITAVVRGDQLVGRITVDTSFGGGADSVTYTRQ